MIGINVELNTCRQKVTFAGIELDTKTEPEEDKQDHLEKVCTLPLDDMVAVLRRSQTSEEDVFKKILYQDRRKRICPYLHSKDPPGPLVYRFFQDCRIIHQEKAEKKGI